MSLTVYDKKRDFRRTPEPQPAKGTAKKKKLTFVVQKHDARKLHYDFRLEMDGVLKSWAIPRGPSMVAGEKRLAVMVEDHPLGYGRFHGEIPKGNYGAGTVEIWDKGTYKPVTGTDDPEKALQEMLKKGDIKFSLNGTYLKGRFAIFHLKNPEKENEWMLVKKADEYAEDTFDIEAILPVSSKAKSKTGKASLSGHADPFPDPPPQPMLAKLAGKIIDRPSWLYEMKLDGYRMICTVRNGKADLISRKGNSYLMQFEILREDLNEIEENVILDGEVVAENQKGMSDFQLLQNYGATGKGNLRLYVFDILYLNGHNIMSLKLTDRKELLDVFFRKYEFKRIVKLDYQTGNGSDLFRKLSGEGYEGVIGKDPESIYIPGKRTDSWIKIKAVQKQEAVICGYTLPGGGRKYFGSLIMGVYEGQNLKYTGNCGTGFTDRSLRELYEKFEPLKTAKCPFGKPPDLSGSKGKPVWLKPKLVASIKFMEWSEDNIMRMPVFMGLRDDKDPREVMNESEEGRVSGQIKDPENTKSAKEREMVLAGKKLRLTNLAKVWWPDEGYTKEDLISYYLDISRFILPWLRDRPQSLNRHPGGIKGESFYHKDMDTDLIPKWVRTVRMESGSHQGGINYLLCNDIAALIYMVNLGCIEINPWHSTYRKPEYPSYLVLDLDPGEISFRKVIETALVIRELCDELRIPSYPKTSGATGMHIYIPLGSKYDYEQARTFAEILASLAHNRMPDATSIERPVSKRADKVYIDFLQNRKGQTIAAPYSVRPRPLATVSTPLSWNEVNHRLSPEMFTITNVGKRLEKTGEVWQPLMKQGISLSKALKAIEKLS